MSIFGFHLCTGTLECRADNTLMKKRLLWKFYKRILGQERACRFISFVFKFKLNIELSNIFAIQNKNEKCTALTFVFSLNNFIHISF